jgi:hypothetical protein
MTITVDREQFVTLLGTALAFICLLQMCPECHSLCEMEETHTPNCVLGKTLAAWLTMSEQASQAKSEIIH